MRHIPRIRTAVIVTLVAGVALAGCSSSGTGGSYVSAPDRAGSEQIVENFDAANDPNSQAADRALIITGSVIITASDPLAAAADATDIVTAAGGRIDARREYAPRDGDQGSAHLTLRVPADRLDAVLASLGELGRVDETRTDSVDVGTQLRDLDIRITTLRTTIARYTTWLADADTTADLIELESAIATRQVELENLEAQKRALDDQVALSTIELTLRSESLAPTAGGPTDFVSALALGWNAFVAFWVGAVVVIGVLLPWLIMFGLIAVAIVWLVRRSRRQALERFGAAAVAPPAPAQQAGPQAAPPAAPPAASQAAPPAAPKG